jgi:hypothetical protein
MKGGGRRRIEAWETAGETGGFGWIIAIDTWW